MRLSLPVRLPLSRGRAAAVLALALVLPGCASVSDDISLAFADPAKYDLYDCKQLEPERKRLAARTAELQGLMAKAETGAGGAVVAEVAYRNEYIATRGQAKLADQAWQKNRCRDTIPGEAMPVAPRAAPPTQPSRAGRSVY
jgi:hypothetical protein